MFLAGFSGLYFTVYAVTDETYREQFFTAVTRELERAVAVRAVYRTPARTLTPGRRSTPPGESPRRASALRRVRADSGVEVLLDQGRDRVDRGLVVAGHLDRVADAGAEGHDQQRGGGVDRLLAGDGEGDLGVELPGGLGDDRGGPGVQADGRSRR